MLPRPLLLKVCRFDTRKRLAQILRNFLDRIEELNRGLSNADSSSSLNKEPPGHLIHEICREAINIHLGNFCYVRKTLGDTGDK